MIKPATFTAPFLHHSLPPDTKIIHIRVYFRVKTTDIDNLYDLYSRTCADASFMIEGVDFTVLYSPMSGSRSLYIIITVESEEGLIFFWTSPMPFKIIFLHNHE